MKARAILFLRERRPNDSYRAIRRLMVKDDWNYYTTVVHKGSHKELTIDKVEPSWKPSLDIVIGSDVEPIGTDDGGFVISDKPSDAGNFPTPFITYSNGDVRVVPESGKYIRIKYVYGVYVVDFTDEGMDDPEEALRGPVRCYWTTKSLILRIDGAIRV